MSLHLPVLVQYDITYKRINSLYKCLIWHAETHPLPFFYTTIKNEKNCHVSYNSAWFLQYGFTYMMHKIDTLSTNLRICRSDISLPWLQTTLVSCVLLRFISCQITSSANYMSSQQKTYIMEHVLDRKELIGTYFSLISYPRRYFHTK